MEGEWRERGGNDLSRKEMRYDDGIVRWGSGINGERMDGLIDAWVWARNEYGVMR